MGFGDWLVNTFTGGALDDAKQAERDSNALLQEGREELDRLKDVYANMDISNPFKDLKNEFAGMKNQFDGMRNQFSGLENTMEDLTVNQQQAQFEVKQNQQNQANIMEGLRGSAGGSGIAALATTLARQGALASQKASASIGQQEAANQMASAQKAGQLQELEAQGAAAVDLQQRQGAAAVDLQRRQGAARLSEVKAGGEERAQGRELDRAGTMMGMQAQTVAGYQDQLTAAQQGQEDVKSSFWDSISIF